jgi:site-specific recombinase XerD
MRLDYAIEGFWLAKRRGFSPHTVADYAVTFRRFTAFVGAEREFEKISTMEVNRFLNHLQEELQLSAKTTLNAWTALSSLWSWAEKEAECKHIIRGRIPRPKWRRPQVEPFSEEEVRKLLAACETMHAWDRRNEKYVAGARPSAVRDRAMVLMLLDCGLRVSELTALNVADYDRKTGQVTIRHGKGDKKRVISVANVARAAIWRYLRTRPAAKPEEPLFVSAHSGERLDRVAVRAMVMRAGQRAGVTPAYPHRFRHTFAVSFLRNGGNPLALQDILGHEKLDTVRIYVKLAAVDLALAQASASPADRWGL